MRRRTVVTIMAAGLLLSANAASADDYVPKGTVTREDVRGTEALVRALHSFAKRADQLQRKSQASKSEIDALAADAESVKRTVPQFQRAASNVVNKLKGAGKWTPELDAFVADGFKANPEALRALRSAGGARALLQGASPTAAGLARKLDDDVKALRGKSAVGRLLEEILGKPAFAYYNCGTSCCLTWLVYRTMCRMTGGTDVCTDTLVYGSLCGAY